MSDYIKFYEKNKFGLKDDQGKVILEPRYDWIWLGWVDKGFIGVKLNEKYGLFDIDGKEIINLIYDNISLNLVDKGFIIVKRNDKYGLFNKAGNQLLPVKYDNWINLIELYQKKLKLKEDLLK